MDPVTTILAVFLTAFLLTYFAIPSIIQISKEKHLFDEPGERSSHSVKTPSLGGIGIVAGAIFSIVLWTPFEDFGSLQYILCAYLILFLIGVKDDISPMSPYKKMIAQILAASILVLKSNIKLSSLYGLLGSTEVLPDWLSILLSIFVIILIVNAFNLIDGINGLAGSIGVLICSTFGIWFFMVKHMELAIISFTTLGGILAFLKYNYTPAKIFMGDTGSLHIGLVSAILTLEFLTINDSLGAESIMKFEASPAIALGIIIIPLFDTIRVFIKRMANGKSPFHPDKNHIHHLLLDCGLSHMQSTLALVLANMLCISFVFSLHNMLGLHMLVFIQLALAALFSRAASVIAFQRKKSVPNQQA